MSFVPASRDLGDRLNFGLARAALDRAQTDEEFAAWARAWARPAMAAISEARQSIGDGTSLDWDDDE